MPIGHEELERRFSFHYADDDAKALYSSIRVQVLALAEWLDGLLPDSREKSIAIHHLEDASMWAVKAHVLQYPTEGP